MRDKLLELLRARPFKPFRVELASGTVHVIRHPDQAMLSGDLAFIGVPRNDAPGSGPDYADVAIVTLAQVTQVETLHPASSAG
jgi:hypothetical protein